MPIMVAVVLAMCFQQGLILFFNNIEQLAFAYEIADILSGTTSIFALFIPLTLCIQNRKNARAATGFIALWLLACGFSISLFAYIGNVFVTPALAFICSIAAIAWLFYLFGEYNRVYYGDIIKELHKRMDEMALSANEVMSESGFTEAERRATLLLLEGATRSEVTRKLSLKAAEANIVMDSIRDKIVRDSDPDPGVAVAVVKFNLTRRETEILRSLSQGMTNAEIANEYFLSPETIKFHVRNLMKKLPVTGRAELPALLESIGEKPKS
jgi:DNA-binding CsgD family transcriptional regulator